MTTLFDATLALAEVLGDVWYGVADSGSTAKLVDAAMKDRAGMLAPGTLFIINATENDLDKSMVEILRHDQNTLYFATLSKTITTGDTFAAFPGHMIAMRHLIKAINAALQDLKQFTQEDATTVTVASQEEYTLPTGVSNAVSVEIAKATSAPYNYSEHRCWEETSAGKLRFYAHTPAIAGYKIRIGYNSPHSELSGASDTLNNGINAERLKYEAAAHAWRDYILRLGKQPADDLITDAIQDAINRANAMESHNILRKSKKPSLAGW